MENDISPRQRLIATGRLAHVDFHINARIISSRQRSIVRNPGQKRRERTMEDKMQKWEYKLVVRGREYPQKKNEYPQIGEWQTQMEDGSWKTLDSLKKFLDELGEQGWELVSMFAESSTLGGYMS